MVTTIKNWIKSPVFETEEDTIKANILNVVLIAFVLLLIAYVISLVVTAQELSDGFFVMSLLALVMCVLLVILRRGHLNIVGYSLVLLSWLVLVYLSSISVDVRGTGITAQIIVILLATLLLGLRAAIAFTILSLAVTWIFAYVEIANLVSIAPTAPAIDVARDVTAIFTFAVVLSYLVYRQLHTALAQARLSNQQLQQLRNELEERVLERTQRAETARQEAEKAQEQAEAARQAIAMQMWRAQGQAALAEQMHGDQTIQDLARKVIEQICHYLNAPVGVLFVVQEKALHLAGSYAYHSQTSAPQQFALDEGLLGEAIQQKKPLIVTDLPPDYLPITSSLGTTTPAQVFIQPLLYAEQVLGVLEVGSFTPFGEQEDRFLRSVSESIAIAFHTAQARARIDDLLLKTQQQAEALQAQEEELRAANEELEAQMENMPGLRQ